MVMAVTVLPEGVRRQKSDQDKGGYCEQCEVEEQFADPFSYLAPPEDLRSA
jgi:hypothetical protein